jgi:hypothetical protein
MINAENVAKLRLHWTLLQTSWRPVPLALFLFLSLWTILPPAVVAQAPVPVPRNQQIPKKGYKTWALFLVCDPSWLANTANSKVNLKLLHDQFVGFGNAVGTQNAAVWFCSYNSTEPGDYDGVRASDYCATYDLKAFESPVVVVTTQYPAPVPKAVAVPRQAFSTVNDPTGNYVEVSLNGLDSKDTNTLLGLLADQVRSGKLDQQQIDSKSYWQSWEHLLRKTLTEAGKLGRGVSVEVDTKVLKITFSGKDLS